MPTYLEIIEPTFPLMEKKAKDQGCTCFATPHPPFAVVCELAALKQHSLRTLSTDASFNAHQLMPFIERFAFSWDGRYYLLNPESLCSISIGVGYPKRGNRGK